MTLSPASTLLAAAPLTTIPLAFDHIGGETFSVLYVVDLHPLVRAETGEVHELPIDGDRSHIEGVLIRDPRLVKLTLEYRDQHRFLQGRCYR